MPRYLMLAALALFCLYAPRAEAQAAQKSAPPTVAVLYFDYEGTTPGMEVLRKGLAQMLITDLKPTEGVTFVERGRLEDVLKELDLASSSRVDKATAARLGKLLGARYLIVGGYFDLGTTLRIDARVVEVETGRILDAHGANSAADDLMGAERQLVEALSRTLTTALPPIKTQRDDPPRKPPTRKTPARLDKATALQYSKALDAGDKGQIEIATRELQAVIKARPDFELAVDDLAAMMQ